MSIDLTVIVKDKNGKLFEGADVTVTPGNFKSETNSDGEATISVDGADRYQVKVEAEDVSQTVPFYPRRDQDEARVEVNLQYFEKLGEDKEVDTTDSTEAQVVEDVSTPWYQVSHEQSGYLLAGAIVLLAVIVLAMRAARKKRERVEESKKSAKKASETKTPSKKTTKKD